MYETTRVADRTDQSSAVDEAFATMVGGLLTSPRVTYAPVLERPVYWAGHGRRPHRRIVLRAGVDLDDPR